MADEGTHYGSPEPEPTAYEELEDLNWDGPDPPVEEAAQLINEILNDPTNDLTAEELLQHVDTHYWATVMEAMNRQDPAAFDPTGSPEPAAQDTTETDLTWVEHATQEALDYVEDMSSNRARRRLRNTISDYQELAPMMEDLDGHPELYDDTTYQKFIGCAGDLKATVEAKEALPERGWTDAERAAAVEHEINRMGFRARLEIQDRLLQQVASSEHLTLLATTQSISQEAQDAVARHERQVSQWVDLRRRMDDPTMLNINDAARFALIKDGIEEAILSGDQATIIDITERAQHEISHNAEDWHRDNRFSEILQMATRWTDTTVNEGSRDYHFPLTIVEHMATSNDGRLAWLIVLTDRGERTDTTNDCVARALNEATGGENYRAIHEALSALVQTERPEEDADHGVAPSTYRDLFIEHGTVPILETSADTSHPLRKHLYIEEIPAMLGHLFNDPDEPLTFISCPERHAQATVDSRLHDLSTEWLDLAERPEDRNREAIMNLWIKCEDPEVTEQALEILKRYAVVRQYDEALTYGVLRRQSTPTGDRRA